MQLLILSTVIVITCKVRQARLRWGLQKHDCDKDAIVAVLPAKNLLWQLCQLLLGLKPLRFRTHEFSLDTYCLYTSYCRTTEDRTWHGQRNHLDFNLLIGHSRLLRRISLLLLLSVADIGKNCVLHLRTTSRKEKNNFVFNTCKYVILYYLAVTFIRVIHKLC